MPVLEACGIRKSFPGVTALAGVDLRVEAGEVHALLGENGAGKSTLMKALAGAVRPDAGEVRVDGEPVPPGSPVAARARGIAIVYQELSLVPSLSVGENVLLGAWPTGRAGTVDPGRMHREAAAHLGRLGVGTDVRAPVRGLGMADRQLIEIAKALRAEVRVLLLDEPTSALSRPEATRLFTIVRDLRGAGVGIVYVSHLLAEVLQIADRITVLRDGAVVDTVRAADVSEADLARMMVGRKLAETGMAASGPGGTPASGPGGTPASGPDGTAASGEGAAARSGAAAGPALLRVRGLACPPRLKPVDLDVRAGEVVAVFGLVGAGRTRLGRTLFGLESGTTGTVEVDGRPVRITSPVDAIAAGLGYLGEDRALGLVPALSVAANITLASLHRLGGGPLLDFARERALARRYVDELGIRTASLDRPVGTLSGGNQQKVLLARWLCSGARLLVLDDPTRGIDVGAKEEVFRLVRRLAADGIGILYLTSELKEARALADRILVMARGRLVRSVSPDAPDDEIMAAAAGGSNG
jgi:ABC-type sugar transport system ATPase subunit